LPVQRLNFGMYVLDNYIYLMFPKELTNTLISIFGQHVNMNFDHTIMKDFIKKMLNTKPPIRKLEE